MDQQRLLMDYTKFHIGVYITLTSAAIALMKMRPDLGGLPSIKIATAGFVIAGISGGVIAGNIPLYSSWKEFAETKIGPWGSRLLRFTGWAHVEHTAFWIAVLAVVFQLGFLS